jgi:oligosaccharide repeat unit polymerase
MNYISAIFFSLAFAIVVTMLKRGADILSPARLFGLVWSVVFGLANLKFSRLQASWSLEQWSYALLGPLSFLLGLYIMRVSNLRVRLSTLSNMRKAIRREKINEQKLFYLICASFMLYILGYVIIFAVKGYIPMFARNPAAARIDYFIFGVGLFIHNMPVVVFFAAVYHLLRTGTGVRKSLLKAMAAVSLLTYLMLLQRYQLMMLSFMIFTLMYYGTKAIRFRTMILFLSMGVLIFYSIATIRVGQIVQMALYTTSQMKFSYDYAIFTEPYMYVVMNIENFVRAVDKLEAFSFGYYTFDFTLALTGLKHWIGEYFGLVETPFLVSGYNTYSIFWTFYRDFGVFGLTFVPLVGGLFVGSTYYALRRDPTVERLSYYCIIVFVIGLSFFLSPLGFLWFAYIVGWIVLILKLVRVRPIMLVGR